MKIKANKRAIVILQLFLVILSGLFAVRGAGEVDPTYNASVNGGLNGSVYVFKVQPDGKILVGGYFQDINGYAASGLGRLNSDLTVDTSFNAPDFGGGVGLGGLVLALELQSDGKIIVGGNIIGINNVENRGLKRLFPDGTLDTSFQPPAVDTIYYDLEVLPNDQILAGGMRLNANGTIDNSFTTMPNVKEFEVLADGKILAASTETSARLRRYNSDGTLDNSFPDVLTNGSIEEIAPLPDGKILFGGSFTTVNGFQQGRISRINANGTLDLTFNQNMTGFNGTVYRIVRQPNGQFRIGGGFTVYNGVTRRYAVLINADGSVDNSFQGNAAVPALSLLAFEFLPDGRMLAGFSSNNAELTLFGFHADGTTAGIPRLVAGFISGITDMALQPDGKLVVSGSFFYSGNSSRRSIARFNTDGSLDTSFVPYYTINYLITAVAVQPDGKILVGMISGIVLDRLNADGSRDTGFSSPFPPNLNQNVRDIAALPDGKFVISVNASGEKMMFFNANGSEAPSAAPLPDGEIRKIVVQPDGKLVIGGTFTALGGNLRVGFARLNANGSVDTSFNPIGGANGAVNDVDVQADGKVVIGGNFTGVNGSLTQKYVGRLNPDGSLDTTFVQDQQINSPVLDVQAQPDGKILAAGGFTLIGSTVRVALARFNTNGTLDSGFIPPQLNIPGITDILLQTDGKILIGGPFTKINGQSHVRLARLLNSATPARTPFDYDGDGRADISVFRPSENKWYILQSSNASLRENVFGLAGDLPVPADFDGDGKTDVAIWRPSNGAWWYLSSISGQQVNVNFGQTGDIPRPSDFDGDGKTDFVVYRPSNSTWYRMSSTGQIAAPFAFGIAEDKPLIADFDGDGKSEPAVFRPSTGDWWYATSTPGQFAVVHWGAQGDVPVPADVDADGKTDFVVYRPSNGGWYILRSGEQNYTILQFGLAEDKPVMADYDGDGKADVAVFRPSSGTWYLLQTTSGFGALQWGNSSDTPTPGAFLP